MDWFEQLEALAVTVNGEETVLLAYGLVTVGLARAGTAATADSTRGRESKLRSFIRALYISARLFNRVPGVLFFVSRNPINSLKFSNSGSRFSAITNLFLGAASYLAADPRKQKVPCADLALRAGTQSLTGTRDPCASLISDAGNFRFGGWSEGRNRHVL
jgi:hypothetical protein